MDGYRIAAHHVAKEATRDGNIPELDSYNHECCVVRDHRGLSCPTCPS
jgi:hypothetical protein